MKRKKKMFENITSRVKTTIIAAAILISLLLFSAVGANANGIDAAPETDSLDMVDGSATEETPATDKKDEGAMKYLDWIYKEDYTPDVNVGIVIFSACLGLIGIWLFYVGFKFAFIEGDWDLKKGPWIEMSIGLLLIGVCVAALIKFL